jgi:methyltransferase-like protein 23
MAAAVGAKVTLTDKEDDKIVLENCRSDSAHLCSIDRILYRVNCELNQLPCKVLGLNWGQFSTTIFTLDTPDIILGADVLYDSKGLLLSCSVLQLRT